jgi:asparagine synthase (glutamine-hydrolysing)
MCGIHGIITLDKESIDPNKYHSALCSLRHRGPDDYGFVLINTETKEKIEKEQLISNGIPCTEQETLVLDVPGKYNLCLGQCRFSIIDLSPAGHQPMYNEDKTIFIIFNGEILNYKELRKELEGKHTFKSQSDTEVIIHGYEEWGLESLVQRMIGFWAFAIYDMNINTILCSRDRFGVKPFFYYFNGQRFIFGSEIKSIFPWISPTLNEKRIAQYFYFKYPDPTATFFNEIHMLAPSCNIILQLTTKQLTTKNYWDIPNKNAEYSDFELQPMLKEFYEHFEYSMKINMRSDVPIALFLSGGIDSTMILGYLKKMSESKMLDDDTNYDLVKLKTFSMIPESKDRSEKPQIDEVLKYHGIEGNYIYVNFTDYITKFDTFLHYLDEPVEDLSHFLNYLMFETVQKENIKIILSGMGGDEIFAGYRPHIIRFLKDLAKRKKYGTLLVEIVKLRYYIYPYLWKFLRRISKIKAKIHGKIIKFKESEAYVPPYAINSLADLLHFDLIGGYGHLLLRMQDITSMIWPIEIRTPFLHHPMVEWAFGLPLSTKIHDGYTKYLLRQAGKSYIPDSVRLLKAKVGFPSSEKSWAIKVLKENRNQIVELHPYIQDFINVQELDKFYDRILKKEREEDIQLFWKIVIFGRWVKKLKEKGILN